MTDSTADAQRQTLQALAKDFRAAQEIVVQRHGQRLKLREWLAEQAMQEEEGWRETFPGDKEVARDSAAMERREGFRLDEEWQGVVPMLAALLREWGLWRTKFGDANLEDFPLRMDRTILPEEWGLGVAAPRPPEERYALEDAVLGALRQGENRALAEAAAALTRSIASPSPAAPEPPAKAAPAEPDPPAVAASAPERKRRYTRRQQVVRDARKIIDNNGWQGSRTRLSKQIGCHLDTLNKAIDSDRQLLRRVKVLENATAADRSVRSNPMGATTAAGLTSRELDPSEAAQQRELQGLIRESKADAEAESRGRMDPKLAAAG